MTPTPTPPRAHTPTPDDLPPGIEARRFARGCQHGVLSTLSKRLDGYPFGSVSPLILDHDAAPVILISDLAEHTKNLMANPRCSLILQPFAPDMHTTGRVTLIGRAEPLADKSALAARYLRYFPPAESYFAMHDFRFWRIVPERIRWIGGFGRIHWVEPKRWKDANIDIKDIEDEVIAHMNSAHTIALRTFATTLFNAVTSTPAPVTLIGVDSDGFDLRVGEPVDGRVYRHTFKPPLTSSADLRGAFVRLAQACSPQTESQHGH